MRRDRDEIARARKEGEEEGGRLCRSFGGPRNTHSGPGGRPSICCSCRFRRKYPPTMYWVLPARPFLFSFFPSPLPFFLSSSSSSSPFSSFYLLPRGARNGPPRTGLSREEGREEKAKVHRCEGEREERQTRSTRRVSQSNITVPRTTSKIAACLSSSSTPFSSFFSILALSTRWSRVEPRLSRFYVCFT